MASQVWHLSGRVWNIPCSSLARGQRQSQALSRPVNQAWAASPAWFLQVPVSPCRWQDASRGSNAWVGQFVAPCQIDSSGKFTYILARVESSALSAKIIIRGKRGCTEAQLFSMFKQEVSVLPACWCAGCNLGCLWV